MQKSMTKFFRNFEGTRFLAVLLSMRREKGMICSKLIVEDKNEVVLKNNLRATYTRVEYSSGREKNGK